MDVKIAAAAHIKKKAPEPAAFSRRTRRKRGNGRSTGIPIPPVTERKGVILQCCAPFRRTAYAVVRGPERKIRTDKNDSSFSEQGKHRGEVGGQIFKSDQILGTNKSSFCVRCVGFSQNIVLPLSFFRVFRMAVRPRFSVVFKNVRSD